MRFDSPTFRHHYPLRRMPAPVVAIAMPTYNHADYISTAISSVVAQTFERWELVVVDDGSTDATYDLAREFKDARVQVLRREHRGLGGLRDSYQLVLAKTSAPLVAVLEGDDCWPADKLQRQVPDFDDPEVVLSYGSVALIDECGCHYGEVRPWLAVHARTNRPTGAIVPSLLAVNPIMSPTVVVRRTALDVIGGFWQPPGVPYVDHPTWLRLAFEGAFEYHEAVVGCWRRHSAQWTTRASAAGESQPEAAYVPAVADRYRALADREGTIPALGSTTQRHADRWSLNKWRLTLLTGSWRAVAKFSFGLIRSGRPRLIGSAVLGLALRGVGSDLEWLQRRRHRPSWPSRRHVRRHHCADPGALAETRSAG
jgi:glycosyltransferase involved in cell wall biosynthesis